MKVKELMEMLQTVPEDREVVLSRDAEGNGYSPLADSGELWYVPYSTWGGDCYNLDEEEEFEGQDADLVLVLWPTN